MHLLHLLTNHDFGPPTYGKHTLHLVKQCPKPVSPLGSPKPYTKVTRTFFSKARASSKQLELLHAQGTKPLHETFTVMGIRRSILLTTQFQSKWLRLNEKKKGRRQKKEKKSPHQTHLQHSQMKSQLLLSNCHARVHCSRFVNLT